MDAVLTPREIQARIRAGQTPDEVAADSGMTLTQIEPFANPVMAERAWFAAQASRGLVRRDGVSTHQSLIELMGDRLANRGLSTADVTWDAWRGTDRLWTLRASFRSGSALHEAVFRYDPVGRFSTAVNDEARWLVGEPTTSHGPQPGRRSATRNADIDSEPTLDLDVTHQMVRPRAGRTVPVADDFEPGDFTAAQLTQVDGVYDLVSGMDDGMDVLYDMLASINEESVRIYNGLTGGSTEGSSRRTGRSSKSSTKPKATQPRPSSVPDEEVTYPEAAKEAEPALPAMNDEAKEPTARIPKSKKRATVPTWDEIMFGSPQADDY